MADIPSTDPERFGTVKLVRSSHPWTQADSAAGFVLRYAMAMRRHLIAALGSATDADEALNLLLTHLINSGFGEHRHGKLRDLVILGLRSAVRARWKDKADDQRVLECLEQLKPESSEWLRSWREGLLERAWRSLERLEHSHPESPVYSILHSATAKPQATPEILVVQIAAETGVQTDQEMIRKLLPEARAMFAQLLADEVADTLDDPDSNDIKQEIRILGLSRAFHGINVETDK